MEGSGVEDGRLPGMHPISDRRSGRDRMHGSCNGVRLQQVRQAHGAQHLRADAVEHGEADIGAILRGIDFSTYRLKEGLNVLAEL
ncbi:hypothetical protein [Pseudoxanthomonas putridarboris]|uniref:hypothetical protein n=1 Tax=Pseudoxanthomonas putridarboris TaxID=752605 RepID=UPI003CE4669F